MDTESDRLLSERRPFVAIGLAAVALSVSRQQVYRLVSAGELETVVFFGQRYVYVASIKQRLSKLRKRSAL